MARKTISQRIALVGGDEIKRQLSQFGQAGEQAFSDVQQAAEKLKGPGAAFARSMDAAQKRIRDLGRSVVDAGRGMRDFGAGMSVAVTAPLVLMGKTSLDAWKVQEEAIRRVDAALRSTGGTVGFTSAELQAMAGEFQKVTTVGDEAILQMQAVLLTFTNIRGEEFEAANTAILNLSAALGTDLQSAAIQVGKALNDPIAGISALARSGIQFTAAQKETVRQLVETGRVAQAQQIILRELDVQFGGMAQTLAQSGFGQHQQALNALGDAFEQVGQALTPVITQLAEITTKLAGFMLIAVDAFTLLPQWGQNTILVLGGIVAAVGPALAILGAMTMGIGGLIGGFASLLPTLINAAALFAGLAGSIGTAVAAALAFVGWPALLAAALGYLLVSVHANWTAIAAFIGEKMTAIREASLEAWRAIPGGLREAADQVRMVFGQVVDFIGSRFNWLEGVLGSFVDSMKAKVQSLLSLIGVAQSKSSSSQAPGFAAGGAVRGPGTSTSDSILSWLSDGEFVVKARAVQHYGTDLFRRLNAMALPPGSLLGGYAGGGLVSGSTVPVAAGPSGPVGPYANLNLSIGGESFAGLMAPRETAERLVRFALHEQAKSAGRRPGWYGGA